MEVQNAPARARIRGSLSLALLSPDIYEDESTSDLRIKDVDIGLVSEYLVAFLAGDLANDVEGL